jgi:hypothetical protein
MELMPVFQRQRVLLRAGFYLFGVLRLVVGERRLQGRFGDVLHAIQQRLATHAPVHLDHLPDVETGPDNPRAPSPASAWTPLSTRRAARPRRAPAPSQTRRRAGRPRCRSPLRSSMSRMLWVWFLRSLESVHRQIASQRPLLAAPQGYLRCQREGARLVGEDPHHPRPPLYLLEQTLERLLVVRSLAWWLPGNDR